MRVDYGHLFIYLYQYADGITRIRCPNFFWNSQKKLIFSKKFIRADLLAWFHSIIRHAQFLEAVTILFKSGSPRYKHENVSYHIVLEHVS